MKKFKIEKYINVLEQAGLLVTFQHLKQSSNNVEYLTFNSKDVIPGTLFICKGANFKEEYLYEAINSGASFYVSDKKYCTDKNIPYIIVNNIRKAMAILANLFDNQPWQELNITAVGGTKGKTTTSFFLKGIADKYLSSKGLNECGLISSIETFDGLNHTPTRRTTPEAIELQHLLRRCVDHEVKRVCMEVSSQGFKYHRVTGMKFDMTIFLNIGEDHISPNEHSDFEDYFQSKMRMFSMSDKTVINMDIENIDQVLESAKATPEVFTFSSERKDADYLISDIRKINNDTTFTITGKNFKEHFQISLPGLFNVENAAAAIIASYHNGIPVEYIKEGIYDVAPTGRMALYPSHDNSLICIVDYAHNGFSFEKLFSSVREEYPHRHLIALFGMPGDKAHGRRKETGKIASKYVDEIILTADDPANESVKAICLQIAEHIDKKVPFTILEDREEAIKSAISNAPKNSIIVITGKGAESSQAIGSGYIDCLSDGEIVKKYFKKYKL